MTELITYKELQEQLLSVGDFQHKALLCTIYAGMARVGEIVKGRYTKTKALQSNAIKSFDNRIELFIKTEKGDKPRKVPIFRNREQWLCDVIEGWQANITGPLFPYSTRWAEKVFREYFPDIISKRTGNVDGSKHTIHWLRGWRYSHYRRGDVTGRAVDSKIVSLMGGWKSSAVPERFYDFTKIDDYHEELENR